MNLQHQKPEILIKVVDRQTADQATIQSLLTSSSSSSMNPSLRSFSLERMTPQDEGEEYRIYMWMAER